MFLSFLLLGTYLLLQLGLTSFLCTFHAGHMYTIFLTLIFLPFILFFSVFGTAFGFFFFFSLSLFLRLFSIFGRYTGCCLFLFFFSHFRVSHITIANSNINGQPVQEKSR